MKTLIKILAYIFTIGGVLGYFLFRSTLFFLVMVVGIALFFIAKWKTIKYLQPGDETTMFGVPVIDFDKAEKRREQEEKKKAEEVKNDDR